VNPEVFGLILLEVFIIQIMIIMKTEEKVIIDGITCAIDSKGNLILTIPVAIDSEKLLKWKVKHWVALRRLKHPATPESAVALIIEGFHAADTTAEVNTIMVDNFELVHADPGLLPFARNARERIAGHYREKHKS
jgi:hypothetical protein